MLRTDRETKRWVGWDLSGVAKDNQQTISLDVLFETKDT
jgi:hypothetical protein